jgi:hypothetical protein
MDKVYTLNDIVMTVDTKKTLESLIRFYPDQKDKIDKYNSVLKLLEDIEPAENKNGVYIIIQDMFDTCQWCIKSKEKGIDICSSCTEDKNMYTNICGWKDDNSNRHYSLELTPWDEWLGMYIKEDILQKLNREDILAHILWEMTFMGFTQEDIKAQADSFFNTIEGIKNGTIKTIPLEDLLKDLKEDYK